ncbi:MAG TPA: hypothetical protein VE968_09100, partial [Sphingomicrobium sp.]|nr:hypothetical protein [Sphingomicrobium sp.]
FAASPIFATPAAKAEIDAKSVAGQNLTTLTFTDHNWDKDTLSVVLKFNNAPPMDPIIQNGGGGPPRGSNNFLPTSAGAFAVDLAIALAIGVVIGLMLRRLAK